MSSNSSGFRVRRKLSFVELPYRGKSFYIDVKAASVKSRITQRILELGGQVESFLTKDLSLLVTDKDVEKEAVKQTTDGPSIIPNLHNKSIPLSRGQALLLKSSKQQRPDLGNNHDLLQSASNLGVKTQNAAAFIRSSAKLLAKLKSQKKNHPQENDPMTGMSPISWDKDKENVYIVKVEDTDALYRPLFKQFDVVPKIAYNETGSPFDVGVVLTKNNDTNNNQSKKKTIGGPLRGGYCESCDHWYKCTLREHLNSSKHKEFVASAENFKSLDAVAVGLPDMKKFLNKNGLKFTGRDDLPSFIKVQSPVLPEVRSGILNEVANSVISAASHKEIEGEAELYDNKTDYIEGESSVKPVSEFSNMTKSVISNVAEMYRSRHVSHTEPTCNMDIHKQVAMSTEVQSTPGYMCTANKAASNVRQKFRLCSVKSDENKDIKTFKSDVLINIQSDIPRSEMSVRSDRKMSVNDVLRNVFDDDDEHMVDIDSEVEKMNLEKLVKPTESNMLSSCSATDAQIIAMANKNENVKYKYMPEVAFSSSSCSFGDNGIGNVLSFLHSNNSENNAVTSGRISVASSKSSLKDSIASTKSSMKDSVVSTKSALKCSNRRNDVGRSNETCSQVVNDYGPARLTNFLRSSDDVDNKCLTTVEDLHEKDIGSGDGSTIPLIGKNSLPEKESSEVVTKTILENQNSNLRIGKPDIPLTVTGVKDISDGHEIRGNPEFSNITEDSVSHEIPNIIDSLISLNNAGSLGTNSKSYSSDSEYLKNNGNNSQTPSRQAMKDIKAKVLENVNNSGSTCSSFRNWLLPKDDGASVGTAISASRLNNTLVDHNDGRDMQNGHKQLKDNTCTAGPVCYIDNLLDKHQTEGAKDLVANWISNQSFDANVEFDCSLQGFDDTNDKNKNVEKEVIDPCLTKNSGVSNVVNEANFKNIEIDVKLTKSLSSASHRTEVEVGQEKEDVKEIDSYNDVLNINERSDSFWSDTCTSVSDCTLDNFVMSNDKKSVRKESVGSSTLIRNTCNEESLQDMDCISVKSGLSSCLTERGIKIKGLSCLKKSAEIESNNFNLKKSTQESLNEVFIQVHESDFKLRGDLDLPGKTRLLGNNCTEGYNVDDNSIKFLNCIPENINSKMQDSNQVKLNPFPSSLSNTETGSVTKSKKEPNNKKKQTSKPRGRPKAKKTENKVKKGSVVNQEVNSPMSYPQVLQNQMFNQQLYSPISQASENASNDKNFCHQNNLNSQGLWQGQTPKLSQQNTDPFAALNRANTYSPADGHNNHGEDQVNGQYQRNVQYQNYEQYQNAHPDQYQKRVQYQRNDNPEHIVGQGKHLDYFNTGVLPADIMYSQKPPFIQNTVINGGNMQANTLCHSEVTDFLLPPGQQQYMMGKTPEPQYQFNHCQNSAYSKDIYGNIVLNAKASHVEGQRNMHGLANVHNLNQKTLQDNVNKDQPHFLSASSNFLLHNQDSLSGPGYDYSMSVAKREPNQSRIKNDWYPPSPSSISLEDTSHSTRSLPTICMADIAEENSIEKDNLLKASSTHKKASSKSSATNGAKKSKSTKSKKKAPETRHQQVNVNTNMSFQPSINNQIPSTFHNTSYQSSPAVYITQNNAGNNQAFTYGAQNPSMPCGYYSTAGMMQAVPNAAMTQNPSLPSQAFQPGYNVAAAMGHSNNLALQNVCVGTGYVPSSEINYNTNWSQPIHSQHQGSVYNAIQTGDTKLRLRKMPLTAAEQKTDLMDFWNVRKAGDCRLVFSANNVGNTTVGKRKADEETPLKMDFLSPYGTPIEQGCDGIQPQSKRRRCLVY